MGVRPPRQGDDESPDTVAFGIAALDEHLQRADVTFPVSEAALLEALGDVEIAFDAKGNKVPISEVLADAPHEEYDTRQELMNALHPVFEARRERANSSVIGQLRSLLPF